MESIVAAQVDVFELQCRVELAFKSLVRQEALAHKVFRLRRFLKIRIAVGIKDDLATLRTREIHFDSAFGKVPVWMGYFRKPKCCLGVADNKKYFHCSSSICERDGERLSLNAFREFWCFLLIVSVRGVLPCVTRSFKWDVVFFQESQSLVGGRRMDVIGVFAGPFVHPLDAELPNHLQLRAAGSRDGIGNRDHATKMRFVNFSDVVLNYQRVADGLDIDRHRTSVVSR